MKRVTIFTVVLLVLLILTISARTSAALDWQSLNANVIDTKEDDTKTILTLQDGQNRIFRVTYQDQAITEAMAETIIKYKNEFYSWQQIHLQDVSFIIAAGPLEIIIIPREIMHDQINLAATVPAGITLTYYPDKDVLYYDFRVMKDNLFIRVAGNYLNEAEMLSKLISAYDNPLAFQRQSDPEDLTKEIDNLKEETEILRQALIYLNNEDWLNRFKTIPPETIKRMVELKQSNPKMTKSELWKELKKEQIKVTKKEFKLLLIIYFNEY